MIDFAKLAAMLIMKSVNRKGRQKNAQGSQSRGN